ncbi:single-strand DNA-binding protein [Mycoplasma testudineum]|uniref:Single-stranded DNA-binding protein n=1 Tax=Mycoplasma testudineum TaxID=244584 RepID=A0A4R6IFK2_9MOLU|nr:single-stranded DNA-binding protein [Mycoplasma testudineum]OYD27117.1 single-stranded DNA-binding protein [Mycoplasma testudineum]TDO21130.1 single-strand DNA-binding protein [Mycoplasma testudineum]
MNNVSIVGRLTKAPIVGKTSSGVEYARFTVAVNRQYRTKEGTYPADFLPVVVWRNQATYVSTYCSKGTLVSIIGSLQSSSYKKDGQTLTSYDINADSVSILESRSISEQRNNQVNTFESEFKEINSNIGTQPKTTFVEEVDNDNWADFDE